ncbi:asparagine synthase (glutamine-hydrolyzing) [Pedobacter sp. KBW06]|uniref:asparagine synthase (glutamine-hydrolyzing) n=1 Tax=Pedobacter sp. KBW06 TaxID=2153359 RepID=UPI000F594A86|nr:asparagine synthase (glutamine-hydrolyzing) [Pedobacter sp. KBW06]RQO67570.1 asparagine synthase (glutamine-hydrolyzing) [Pedobacter sp. KBW06]
MCGIAGLICKNGFDSSVINSFVKTIQHRGPDDHGFYKVENAFILNTRLSIIDIESGHQPFISDDENIVLVQNGEIYNYIELKQELIDLGYAFKSSSDTEVLLVAYQAYGANFVNKLNGMFAIAIIDKIKNKLSLYRDRLGVKPLYIYQKDDTVLFSSEIKTFTKYPGFDNTINDQAIHNFLVYNYVPIPQTIFKYVSHIQPGYFYEIDLGNYSIAKTQYWKLENSKEDLVCSDEEYLKDIDELLLDATKIRLRSDVPVGAFLSGGLDSSLICAYMHKITGKPFNTYTIGFKEKEFDESEYAKYITNKYGLNYHEKILEADIVELWAKTTWYNDQPHGDISFIPTFIVSEFAAKDHKLVLTGDGGDELFAGYTKYLSLEKYDVSSKAFFDSISLFREGGFINSLYTSEFKEKINLEGAFNLFSNVISKSSNKDNINQALYFDTVQLLPGNNLVKPDKMAMANSLETRSPFLDYRFFEMMMRVPGNMKLKNNDTKYILKKLALNHFSEDHVYRKKQMFTVPVGEWFKTKLSSYLIETLSDERFVSRKIFNQDLIIQMVNEHISGEKNYTRELRAIVNLEIWFRQFID